MPTEQVLPGACTCGRNRYVIVIPSDANDAAEVLFGNTSGDQQAHSSPLPAFLRIPLPWLQSTTYAYYPDESHSAIRRSYTPFHAPHTKRHFCGFCGTPLTYWSEADTAEAEMISVNLSSLRGEGLNALAAIGLLPSIADGEEERGEQGALSTTQAETGIEIRGQPWFEELIEGSELGKIWRRRGGQTSADGKSMVEWEVVEFNSGGNGDPPEGGTSTGKRKHGDATGEEDLPMREGY
ncbi:hypothetical protein MMC30_005922 [Trapelia coarctata]|nr:hypothetical protein [Trapelia coarctata]